MTNESIGLVPPTNVYSRLPEDASKNKFSEVGGAIKTTFTTSQMEQYSETMVRSRNKIDLSLNGDSNRSNTQKVSKKFKAED